jgi:UDP-N-acetylmuramoyl-L-alanyl-D-glutamate--2,6-diaminopimelate ligase
MKTLAQILEGIPMQVLQGSTSVGGGALVFDSRKVNSDSVFFAIKGTQTDGHQYIDQVIAKGCRAIVLENTPASLQDGVCYIQVKNAQASLALAAANFYEHPSKELKLIGITGTNGKTTTATLLFQLFSSLGYKCGLLSTVQNQIGDDILPSTHTTPDPVSLQSLLRQMVDAACTHVAMEVSSHAIHQHRIDGLHFTGGIFSNITHDHLDYHGTFEEYLRVKKSFFDNLPATAFALSNVDDKRGRVMLQNTKAMAKTYSLWTVADFKAKILENSFEGLMMNIDEVDVHFRMIGQFNAYNLLAVYAAAILTGEHKEKVLQALSDLRGAAGRFEVIRSSIDKIVGIVDYAHTPDALENVLSTIAVVRDGNEKLITVVGCGGDRDRAKRPLMAAAACKGSNLVILTSDNPRSENPESILEEMNAGVPPSKRRDVLIIADRKSAIQTACRMAQGSDIILVAGKGHETYQEIKGEKHDFDDRAILTYFLNPNSNN